MKNVLIADDHGVTRRGLREIVLERFPGAQVTEAGDGDTVVSLIHSRPWDLMLLDVLMPGPGILGLLAAVRSIHPKLPVLVLTASTEVEYVVETLQAGGNGLVHKHEADIELVSAIERVAAGGTYLHPDTAAAMARSMTSAPAPQLHSSLSAREMEILRRIAQGQAIKEIAFALELSSKTVATYLARIRTKTGLVRPVEMARYAFHHGLVD